MIAYEQDLLKHEPVIKPGDVVQLVNSDSIENAVHHEFGESIHVLKAEHKPALSEHTCNSNNKPGEVIQFTGSENPVKRFWKLLGPGLITGASDDDPSGIGTYSMAGASFGFSTLWTAVITFPMMTVIQYICAKIGMVSGQGLADVLRTHYPKKWLYSAVFALFIANTINAGADLGAMAAAINLLFPKAA